MIKRNFLKLALLTLVLGLVSGCATTDQMKQMQASIDRAQASADAALAAAKAAGSAAEVADSRASAAMDAASAAQNQADDCSERCNRIMSKAMSK